MVRCQVGIPDRQIGIGANRNRALLRIKFIELGGVRRSQGNEFVEAQTALADPLREQQRHAHFQARDTVGDFLEGRVGAGIELTGFVVAVRCVVGGEDLKGAVFEAEPDRLLPGLVAGRR